MFNKIVVPLDGSDLAEAVLQHVEPIAKDFKATVILLRVAEQLVLPYLTDNPFALTDIARRSEEECLSYLESVSDRLRARGIETAIVVQEGVPANVILDVAEKEKVDLIAMTTHGRSGIGRWLVGSVADRVVQGSHIPVLLVRGLATQKASDALAADAGADASPNIAPMLPA